MPVHSKPLLHNRALVGAAIAVPIAAILLYAATRKGKSKAISAATSGTPSSPLTATAVSSWSEARVCAWLKELGVSESTIALFSENGIDGKTLLLLHEGHLKEIGVTKIGDRLKLNSALEALRKGPTKAPSITIPSAADSSDRVAPQSSSAAEGASASPISPGTVEEQLHVRNVTSMVVKNLEELFSVFANEEFIALPREQQLSLIAKAESSYATIVSAIAKLPVEHQRRLMAFADNFESLLKEVKKAFGSDIGVTSPASSLTASSFAPKTASASQQGDVLPEAASAAAIQQLVPLLKQFHEALESPAFLSASPAQRKELCDSIIGQVTRMRDMSQRLHPSHATSLSSICDRILKIAQNRLGSSEEEAPQPPPRAARSSNAPSSEDVTPQLLQRLRALFEVLKDPNFLESLAVKDPREIRSIVARLRGEINAISEEAEAKIVGQEQRRLINGVIENVLSILSQVSMLGATKVENDGTPITPRPQDPEVDGESPPKTVAAAKNDFAAAERANAIATRLKTILKVLEDPEYRKNPIPHRSAVLDELTACRDGIASLPDDTKLPLSQLLGKIVEVFQMSLAAAANGKQENAPAKVDASVGDNDNDDDEDFAPSPAFNKIKENLESVFTALNSDEFQQGERHTQNRFCQRLLGVLRQIEGEIDTKVVEPAEQDALKQLSDSLTNLVERLIEGTNTNSPAAPASKAASKTPATPPARVPITPQQAIEKIQTIKNILTSKFGELQPQDQLKIANGMLADLKDTEAKITATCSLSAADRTAVPAEQVALFQQHITPIVQQMKSAIESLVIGLTSSTAALRGAPATDAAVGADEDEYNEEKFEEESDEEDDQAAPAEEDDDDDFKNDPRRGLFSTVQRATELIKTGRINTITDIKECMALLQDVDKVGTTNQSEVEIRNEFMIAIRDLTQKMRAQNDAALKTKQRESQVEEIEEDEEDESVATSGSRRPKAIAVLIAKMKLILEDIEYRADTFNSLSELLPYMTAVEAMLGKLDEEGENGPQISWKSDPEAVEVVSETLSRIQDIQEAIAAKAADGERQPSEMEEMLSNYRQMLEEGFEEGTVTDRAHLAPFMEVVHQTHDVEGLTIEESQELMRLQKSILAISEKLVNAKASSKPSSKASSPNNRDQSPKEKAAEETETTAPQQQQQEPEKRNDEASTTTTADESSHLNFNGGVLGNDTDYTATMESAAPEDTNDTTGLMPRRQSREDGDDNNTVKLDTKDDDDRNDNVGSIENVEGKVNENDKEDDPKVEAINEELEENKKKEETLGAPDIGAESNLAEHVPGSLQQEVSLLPRILQRLQAKDFVANTTLFELYAISSMILRLEESDILKGTELIKLVAMIKNLFAKALQQYFKKNPNDTKTHPNTHGNHKKKKNQKPQPKMTKEQEQKETEDHILNCLHSHFTRKAAVPVPEHLRNHTKNPQSAMFDLPVRLTGLRSENTSAGEGVIHYTIFSLEESGYGVDDSITGPLLASEASDNSSTPRAPSKNPSTINNLAILIGPRGQVEAVGNDSEETSLAELAMLDEILQHRFGYDTHIAVSNDLSSDEVHDIIADTVHEHLEKHAAKLGGMPPTIPSILVYLHTPDYPRVHPENGMPLPQYAINFPYADQSSLPHREIINAIGAAALGGDKTNDGEPVKVGHVTVLHDLGHSLQMLTAVREEPTSVVLTTGHHVAVTLTEASKSVANASRVWLYDGLFTPLICEMLTVGVDDHNKAHHIKSGSLPQNTLFGICAEDFINYPTIVIAYKEMDEEEEETESGKTNGTNKQPKNKSKKLPLLPKIGRSVIPNDLSLSTIII